MNPPPLTRVYKNPGDKAYKNIHIMSVDMNRDGRQESSLKVKPKGLDRPLVAGCCHQMGLSHCTGTSYGSRGDDSGLLFG